MKQPRQYIPYTTHAAIETIPATAITITGVKSGIIIFS